MQETKSDIIQGMFLIISIIISVYPFISKLNPAWKVIGLILGGIGFWSYLQFLFKEWITNKVLESEKMIRLKENLGRNNQKIKEEVQYIKGWMDALNHWHKDKKGKAYELDPITVLVVTVVAILIILVLMGKI